MAPKFEIMALFFCIIKLKLNKIKAIESTRIISAIAITNTNAELKKNESLLNSSLSLFIE